jgi:hypothetical protein
MEYRGIQYAVVQTIANNWRWSVERVPNDKVGTAFDRASAMRAAQKFIDRLIRLQSKAEE